MKCVLTFDLGGSKVYVGVLSTRGELLGEYRSSGANPVVQGESRCRKVLLRALKKAAESCGFTLGDVAVVTGNAFQADVSDDAFLLQAFPDADVYLTSEPMLNAMLSLHGSAGYTFHSGTGSYVSYFDGNECTNYGGFGRTYGDVGSGCEIGRLGVLAALHALDGSGEQTQLLGLLSQKCGVAEGEQFFDRVLKLAEPGILRGAKYFCTVTPLVFEAARGGDAVACTILRDSARALADYCRVLMTKRACPEEGIFGVSGGVFAAGTQGGEENLLLHYLKEELAQRFPKLSCRHDPLPLWQACYACYCRGRGVGNAGK